MNPGPRRRRPRYTPIQMGRSAEAAWEAALSVVVGAFLGYFADKWLGTGPVFTIALLLVGMIAAFRRLLRLSATDRSEPPKNPPRGNGAAPPD
ncbi:MAG TPA: AtpZ/AtpI family protein [Myxococcota bacterium]|nr:AtpZ/AtpI family protein [Myxococcota bacterium]